jgi:1-acyl-sn-glycerol-3-phosphate acyltransferase
MERGVNGDMTPAFRVLRQVGIAFATCWHGLRGRPRHNPLPQAGGCILAATHVSSVDPLLLQSCCPRLIHWMMAREYYGLPGVQWLFRRIGPVPVNRTGQDLSATRAALRLLRDRRVVGIFPAGDIQPPGQPQRELKEGAAMLALASRVPIIPARIFGVSHRSVPADWLGPHRRTRVEFGRAIDLADLYPRPRNRETIAEATRRLQEALRLD